MHMLRCANDVCIHCRAFLWYVAVRDDMRELMPVPPIVPRTKTEVCAIHRELCIV